MLFFAKIGKTCLAMAALMCGLTSLADDPVKKDAPAPEKILGSEVGTWDADVTVFLPNTDPKGFKSKAVETNVMMGNWMISDFKGDFGGQEFLGHGQTGFDAKKGKYVGTWLDSMSTSIATMEGTYDPATKTLTMYADIDDPQTGKTAKTKFTSVMGEDVRVFTEFVKSEGSKEFTKFMEITYKKRAK